MSIDVVDEVFFLKKRQGDHLEIFHEALHTQLLHSFYGYRAFTEQNRTNWFIS